MTRRFNFELSVDMKDVITVADTDPELEAIQKIADNAAGPIKLSDLPPGVCARLRQTLARKIPDSAVNITDLYEVSHIA